MIQHIGHAVYHSAELPIFAALEARISTLVCPVFRQVKALEVQDPGQLQCGGASMLRRNSEFAALRMTQLENGRLLK
jgi:hypothetical protein